MQPIVTETAADLFGAATGDEGRDHLVALARQYLDEEKYVEQLEAALKEEKERRDTAETALFRKMEELRTLSVKVEVDGHRPITLSAVVSKHYAAPGGALEDNNFFTWLLRSGGGDLVRRTIHHSTFSGFVRELAEAGRPLHTLVKIVERKCIRKK